MDSSWLPSLPNPSWEYLVLWPDSPVIWNKGGGKKSIDKNIVPKDESPLKLKAPLGLLYQHYNQAFINGLLRQNRIHPNPVLSDFLVNITHYPNDFDIGDG